MSLQEEQIQRLDEEVSSIPVEDTLEIDAGMEMESESPVDSAPKETHKKEMSYKEAFDAFLVEIESQPDAEAKLHKAISFMESSLSQGGNPHFKSFWEARNLCVDLFKQNINPTARAALWNKYIDLSKEARRLKDILEEQSAFAAEQIEIAVLALEKDIDSNEAAIQELGGFAFEGSCRALEKRADTYGKVQRELNLLNAQASRINALRKELIKTEMRIKQKNKFFQRLSAAGDKVFPRRKELIKEISQFFVEDVDAFIAEHFAGQEMQESLFFLREEIKLLQGMAKQLTLNTHAFTHTRLRLSQCWDSVKEVEKERKKVRAQQKSIFKQNFDDLHGQIALAAQTFAEGQLSLADGQKKLDEIGNAMRQMELGRDELKLLREELAQARKPILEKFKEMEQEKQQQERDREDQRKKSVQEIVEQCEELIKNADSFDAEMLAEKRQELVDKIDQSVLSKIERQDLERRLKPLRDLISEKKERALLDLSDDDRQLLQQLKVLLKEKKELRQEVKTQLEQFRKASHGSGLDFEQSMSFNAQLAAEKERLEKINQGIREIESRIDEIENC